MTQKCLPCRGIQRLTPVSIFNRSGLSRIGYRVGIYAEFFESMLAALGDAGPITEGPERVARALDYLRTRAMDDPSIAMLDAWALVADVLTFYQELVANEAFLNTATQASSLHELSRLLGYVPRPGLSSSVLLSFEVDDRSDEVNIPAGTPAKSTPLPGTPDQPQTFETSEGFVARAEWNRIRPRLTKPQGLRQEQLADVDRIYVRRTGLRINTNDWIAIGNREGRTATLKQVEFVEERSDTVIGALTVLHLVGDALAARTLLNEFINEIDLFFAVAQSSSVLDTNKFDVRKTVFTDEIKEHSDHLSKGLSYIDSELQTNLIERQVLDQTLSDNLRAFIDGLSRKAESISSDYPMDAATSKYQAAIKTYKDTHGTAQGILSPWKTAVMGLNVPVTPADKVPLQLALQRALGDLSLGVVSETQPTIVYGMKLTPEVTMGAPSFPELSVQGFVPASPPAGNFKVEFQLTDGLALSATSLSPQPLTALETAWTGVTRASAPGPFNDFILFVVKDDPGDALIAAGVHEIGTPGSNGYFRGVRPNRTLVNETVTAGVYRVDIDFVLGLTDNTVPPTTEFSLDATLLKGDGNLTWGSYTLGTEVTKANLNQLKAALIDARFTPTNATPQRVIIQFTLNVNGQPRFYGIRTLIIDGGASYVRQQLAECLNDDTKLQDLKNTMADTNAALGAVNANSISSAHTAFVENQNLPNEPALIKELSLQNVNTTLNDELNIIRTELSALIHSGLFLNRINTAANLLPNNPVISRQTSEYDTALARVGPAIATFKGAFDATELKDRLFRFANALKGLLHARRSRFVGLLAGAKADNDFSFSDASKPLGKEVKEKLTELFATSGGNSLMTRVADLNTLALDAIKIPTDLSGIGSKIAELQTQAQTADLMLSDEELVGEAKLGAARIRERWTRVYDTVKELPESSDLGADGGSSDIDNIRDILQQIARGTLTLDSATASLFFNVLQTESQLWTQITAALNPSEAAQILATLRSFRNVESRKVTKPQLWVFRSQANLFGWNSPGKLEPQGSPSQLVLDRDSPRLKPIETNNIAFLDGKFKQTAENGLIAIQRPTSDVPSPYWISEVKFAPRTDYELSGETTQITLEQPWWPLPTSPTHTDFAIIRGTRVWCDMEELELAEELLQDDSRLYHVSDQQSPFELELNQFSPYLSAGCMIVVSGVTAPEQLTSDTIAPKRDEAKSGVLSELVTVIGVTHDFNKILYGDAVKTTLQLNRPLSHLYWRDTVEIAANIVLATHGETVRETIGSGDARRTFQKFALSKAPLTRLPAADADGQQPQLEVRVNNVQWQPTDRLLDHDQQAEIYEIQASRTAANRVQFGDGVNGSRVPTGQDNVQAKYRTGIGQAGNVETGRIDQLPSPPLGVQGVSNPVVGEGGADPDTVGQTKPRIPRAPIRAARLISRRDYESFALLFAGVDKAKAILEHGAVRLIIAGVRPGPLREDGLLLQSLKQAIDRFADPNVPVIVGPHSGKLLFVKATLNIDERADWEVVKDAAKRALARRFGYENAQLGQAILASDVVNTIQNVQYVRFVRIEKLDGFTTENINQVADQAEPSSAVQARSRIDVDRHELCYVADSVDNTVVLEREL